MDLSLYVYRGLSILIAITLHEYAHSLAAYRLGDNTSSNSGRMSFNPLDHIDPVGAIFMVLFGFGWAKPVMVDARNFKNPKVGMGLTALAGPLMNLLLGFLSYAVWFFGNGSSGLSFITVFAQINVSLFIFNMLPIPPLDGSKVLGMLLPEEMYFGYMRYEQYGFFILLFLVFLGALNGIIMNGIYAVFSIFDTLLRLFV